MKVLVTGGSGFIGSYLVRELVKKKYKVRCLVREGSNIGALKKLGVELWFGDLMGKKSLRGIAKDIDVVFHLAAVVKVKAVSKKHYAVYGDVNVKGTANLLKECTKVNIKKFIHFSSIAAMGNLEKIGPISEMGRCKPKTVYEKTKRESELVCLKFWKKYNIPVVILRPSMVYGGKKKEANKIEKSVGLRIVPILGDGKNLIHMVHVKDVAKAAMLSMKRGRSGEIYIISDESYTWNNFVDTIAVKMGIRIFKLHIPIFASRIIADLIESISKLLYIIPPFTHDILKSLTSDTVYDISKARKELGYKPTIKFSGIKSK